MKLQRPCYLSLASYPRMDFADAMRYARLHPPTDPLIGSLSLSAVQLCPQNHGVLDREYAAMLLDQFPDTSFRLHANVRVLPNRYVHDWCNWTPDSPYWKALAAVSRQLKASAYTAHAGRRADASFTDIVNAVQRAGDEFCCPVAIEGHYPTKGDVFLISTWEEYAALFESGVHYVMDLSHLNILAIQSHRRDDILIQEMLASDRCLEVHLSANDGMHDQHRPLSDAPWWWPLLDHVNPAATIFSEANLLHSPNSVV
jgi:hypothetical protein